MDSNGSYEGFSALFLCNENGREEIVDTRNRTVYTEKIATLWGGILSTLFKSLIMIIEQVVIIERRSIHKLCKVLYTKI